MIFSRIILLVCLAIFLFWDYFLIDSFVKLQQDKSKFKTLGQEYQQLVKKIKQIDSEKSTENITEELALIKQKLYQNARVRFSNAEFLAFLSQAANALGLTDIRPEMKAQKRVNPNLEKLAVKLRLRARYHEVARFINMLEKSPYLIRVQGFSIVRGKKDPTGPTYATIVLTVFRFI